MRINTVVVEGRLTRDPELRHTPGGTAVCQVGIAHNARKKQGEEWVDDPHFFDVTIWGNLGERCANRLSKGSLVVVDGNLRQERWEDKETGANRSKVTIVARNVVSQDLIGQSNGENTSNPAPQGEFAQGTTDSDIPF